MGKEEQIAQSVFFGKLIKKHTHELTKGLSPRKFLLLDHCDLNRQAIKLAQVEWRAIQKQMIKI